MLLQNVCSANKQWSWVQSGSQTWARPSESCTASNVSVLRYVLTQL